jgi:vacuolar-type H+-ATPase subunit F/Vma7
MARVAVIGEPLRIYGYGLAGAVLRPASDRAEAITAWRDLPGDIAVAVLTPSAARWLSGEIAGRPGVLPALLPGGPAEPGGLAERAARRGELPT